MTDFLKRRTALMMARQAILSLQIPEASAAAGTYQSPRKSRLLAAAGVALGGQGLTRASHLLDLMQAADAERSKVYTAASSGSWESPALNLRRRAAALLPRPEALVRPATARAVLNLLNLASFS